MSRIFMQQNEFFSDDSFFGFLCMKCTAILWVECIKENSTELSASLTLKVRRKIRQLDIFHPKLSVNGYRIVDDKRENPSENYFLRYLEGVLWHLKHSVPLRLTRKIKNESAQVFVPRLSLPYAIFVFLRLVCGWTSGWGKCRGVRRRDNLPIHPA